MFKCGYLSHGLYVSFGLDGNVLPCCYISKSNSDLKREPTDDLLNGPLVKSFRQTAIKGDIPDICTDCVNLEKLTGRGPRLENIYFDDTTVKETIVEEDVRYLQIRLSNVCNFKCTICSSSYSHLIGKENGEKNPLKVIEDSVLTDLKQRLPKMINLKFVIFGGGEPFHNSNGLIELLDYIPRTAAIAAHTNGSVFNKPLLRKLSEFKTSVLTFSLDGTDRFFNYQRSNGNWNDVKKNIRKIQKFYPKIRMHCDHTATCVTLPNLKEFLRQTTPLFTKVKIHFIKYPNYYQINLLKEEVLNHIKNQIKDEVIRKNINEAINNPPSDETIKEFWNYTDYLARNRTNIYDYIPEIKDYIRCVN